MDTSSTQTWPTFDTSAWVRVSDSCLYYWRVCARNHAGAGPYSQPFSFFNTGNCPAMPKDTSIGVIKAVAFVSASDANLKTGINPITNSLDKINALSGITYYWDTTACPAYMNVDDRQQIGLIAQDVEPIVPEVVYTDTNGYKFIDYGRLVPVLIESIKELTARVAALEGQNNKSMVIPADEVHQKDVTLQNDVIILDQNNPNPFKEFTTIHYFIPEHITYAQIVFSDVTGKIIQTVDINESGDGQLNVMAEKLSSGMYSYSIIVDGKVVDTKKMVKTR